MHPMSSMGDVTEQMVLTTDDETWLKSHQLLNLKLMECVLALILTPEPLF